MVSLIFLNLLHYLYCVFSSWPLIFDPDGIGIHFLLKKHKDEKIIRIQHHPQNLVEMKQSLESAIKEGHVFILEDIQDYESELENVLERKVKDEEVVYIFNGQELKMHPDFRLYLICNGSDALAVKYISKCQLVNFASTDNVMNNMFSDVIFENENEKGSRDLEKILIKEVNLRNSHDKKQMSMLRLMANTEDNEILTITTKIVDSKSELLELDKRQRGSEQMKRHLQDVKISYKDASNHAVILFNVVQKMKYVNYLYKYSLNEFLRILRTSLENSNKSRSLEKRMRYIKDHFTYSLYQFVGKNFVKIYCIKH